MPKQFLKRVERTRLRRVPVLRLGQGAGLGPAGQPDPRRRRELRLRLLARARAVGAAGLRLPGDRRAELRRHLLLQLHEDRAAAGRARATRTAARWRTPARARSTCSSRRSASPGAQVAVRDRPRDPPPPARRARRHRADARAGRRRSPSYEREREQRAAARADHGAVGRRAHEHTTSSRCPATGSARRSWRPTLELLEARRRLRVRGAPVRRRLDRRARAALTDEVLDAAARADAVLLAAVGGPKWDTTDPQQAAARAGPARPAQGARAVREPAPGQAAAGAV